MPLIRAVCKAANLVCPPEKIDEGFARLLVKNDIALITRKEKLLNVTAVEDMLSEAWAKVLEVIATREMVDNQAYAFFGKASARAALFLVKKGKHGIEGK